VYTGFWWGNLRVRDYLGDTDVDGTVILRWIRTNDFFRRMHCLLKHKILQFVFKCFA
jgi:hypothetical protein